MKKIKPDGSKTIYVGGIYEVDKTSGGSVTRTVTYYPAGGAMRINSTLYYILKDHLGSASVVTDASGNILGEQRYYPFGETRLTTGTIYTDRLFTGQREMAGLGIYHFNARFYSAKLGRFLSADSIVPSYVNPQSLNRFSYVANNPLRYTDPTGHRVCDDVDSAGNCITAPGSPAGGTGNGGGGNGGGDSGGGDPDWQDLENSGYDDWEIDILQELYNNGGQYGINGVWDIINNGIHIQVGEPYHCSPGRIVRCIGDWQSTFQIGAWYDSVNNLVVLNPNSPGVQNGAMPSDYALSNVVHEAIHILQGSQASTAYGELEAWQTGFSVLDALNGDLVGLSETQQAIVNLPLNHDSGNLITAVNLMLEDQNGQYLGAYPLYFSAIFNP